MSRKSQLEPRCHKKPAIEHEVLNWVVRRSNKLICSRGDIGGHHRPWSRFRSRTLASLWRSREEVTQAYQQAAHGNYCFNELSRKKINYEILFAEIVG